MLKNIKNQRIVTNKGITLIALVVTIVVLLILAGITINAILSEGGILNTAKRAENVQQEATLKETVQVMLADAKLQSVVNKKELVDYLIEEGYTVTNETEETITIEEDGYEITIDKNTFQITEMTQNESNEEETTLAAGLYNSSDELLATWEELEEMGLDVNGSYDEYSTEGTMKYVLNNNEALKNGSKLIISDNVTINEYVFNNCNNLTSVVIPGSVTSIGFSAFYYCKGLTSVTISEGVTSIGARAFYYCTGLTSITIPGSVTSIENSAFMNCSGLTNIEVNSDNEKYDSRENSNAIIETATNTLIAGCKNTVIPESVTSIGNYAFYGCSGLTSITIPTSVTSIGDSAFSSCSGLTSVTISEGVTSIYYSVFIRCSSLTSVIIDSSTIAKGITSTDSYGNLINYATTIYIREDITEIGSYITNNYTAGTVVDGYIPYTKN